jgi:hypothetical protein
MKWPTTSSALICAAPAVTGEKSSTMSVAAGRGTTMPRSPGDGIKFCNTDMAPANPNVPSFVSDRPRGPIRMTLELRCMLPAGRL